MKSLIAVHHVHLRHRKLPDGSTMPVTDLPATIAHDAIDAAKGGSLVALHMPGADEPIMVEPEADHAALTDKIAAAMPKAPAPAPMTEPAPASDPAPDVDEAPMPVTRRGRKPAADNPLDD